ncbi:MAG: serine hydrolase [Planctomycetota bacterium]
MPSLRTTFLAASFGAVLAACAGTGRPVAGVDRDALRDELLALVEPFEGRVGIFASQPSSGTTVEIRADETFPTASLVKVPILLALFERVESGEIGLHDELEYDASRSRGGEDLVAAMKDGSRITVSKLVHLMCAFSDNTASLWLQELAGGGAGINAWLDANGYEVTRVNSRTPGREQAYEEWGWGQTTPREMCRMFESIADGTAVSPRASEEMARVLSGTYWDSEACSEVPPYVEVMSKQGAISRSRSEVLVVHAARGRYVFCVVTDDQADTSWSAENAGFVLARDVSRVLWRRFGADGWSPAPGVEAWH